MCVYSQSPCILAATAYTGAFLCAMFLLGCDGATVRRLQMENDTLRAQLASRENVTRYELAGKCSEDAGAFFRLNFPPDRTYVLHDVMNHYNRSENKCFALVETHSKQTPQAAEWANEMSLWDVQENAKIGDFLELHDYVLNEGDKTDLLTCDIDGKQCKSLQNWNGSAYPYMNN